MTRIPSPNQQQVAQRLGPIHGCAQRMYPGGLGGADQRLERHAVFGVGTFLAVSGDKSPATFAAMSLPGKAIQVARIGVAGLAQLVLWAPVAAYACLLGAGVRLIYGSERVHGAVAFARIPVVCVAVALDAGLVILGTLGAWRLLTGR